MEIGPVQLIVFGFDRGARFEGKVAGELQALEGRGTIRLLDLLFLTKDDRGDVLVVDSGSDELGAIIGTLLGFEFEGFERPQPRGEAPGELPGSAFGLSAADIEAIGAGLGPGQSAALLMVEHLWARELRRAIREAGGTALAEGFVRPDALALVEAELGAMVDSSWAVEAAQEEQGQAALERLAGSGQGQTAASAATLRVLIDGGFLEPAAAPRALEALAAAGLVERVALTEAMAR